MNEYNSSDLSIDKFIVSSKHPDIDYDIYFLDGSFKNNGNVYFIDCHTIDREDEITGFSNGFRYLPIARIVFMYLTECQRYAVEEFVGQLPPYTKFNNFVYRISQMGLTAVENSHAK